MFRKPSIMLAMVAAAPADETEPQNHIVSGISRVSRSQKLASGGEPVSLLVTNN